MTDPKEKGPHAALDRLLNALSVSIRTCVVCSIPKNTRARFDPVDTPTVMHVVSGTAVFQWGNQAAMAIGENSIVIVPAKTLQFCSSHENAVEDSHGHGYCSPIGAEPAQSIIRGRSDGGVSVVRSEIDVTHGGVPGFFDHLRRPIIENLIDNEAARQIFQLMVGELAQPGTGSKAVVEGLMRGFLVLLLRRHLQAGNASSSMFAMMSDPRLACAMANVLEQPDQPHTLESLSAAAGMSRTVFADRFKEAFAQSPNEFIQEFRLKFAAHLLKTTNLPIKAVAASVGYSSRSYFSHAFRTAFTIDPTAYRAAHRSRPH